MKVLLTMMRQRHLPHQMPMLMLKLVHKQAHLKKANELHRPKPEDNLLRAEEEAEETEVPNVGEEVKQLLLLKHLVVLMKKSY